MSRNSKTTKSDDLRAHVLAALPDLLPEWLPDGEFQGTKYIALNPNRTDSNLGSFQIDLGTGAWRDYAIDKGGPDAVSLHAYLFNFEDYKASAAQLAKAWQLISAGDRAQSLPKANVAKRLNRKVEDQARARKAYDAAVSLANQPAQAYLASRALRPTEAWERLRASSAPYPGQGLCPVLIAPIEASDGTLVGVQRTYLQPSGRKLAVPNPRRSLGQVKGNAIHLGEAEEELIICEGLEDGLTLHQELGLPVWVACGAGFLSTILVPEHIRTVIIAADNDHAGTMASFRAADAMAVLGRRVRILRPSQGFKDFNDELCGVRYD